MAIRRIITRDPTLQSILDSASRTFQAVADEPLYLLGEPSSETIRAPGYICKFNQLTRVDPSQEALTIGLPRVTRVDIGKCVTVVNVTASANQVSVYPYLGTINGASSYSLAYAYFRRTFVCVGENKWIDDSKANLESVGPQAFFEWNGTDLTQFDSAVSQTGISMTAAVAAYNGLNWVDLSVVYNAATVPPTSGLFALLPITITPPSADYMITADVMVPQHVGDGRAYPMLAVRGDYAVGVKTFYRIYWATSGPPAGSATFFLQRVSTTTLPVNLQTFSSGLAVLGDGQGLTMRLSAEGSTMLKAMPHVVDKWIYRDNSSPITAVGKAAIGVSQSTQTLGSFTRHYLFRNIRLYEIKPSNYTVTDL